MKFEQAVVNSGSTTLQGFKLDGKFSNVEGIPNYLCFQWLDGNGNQPGKFWLNWNEDFYLELISINGGNNNSIGGWESYINLPNNNNFLIWSSNFNGSQMPFNFPKGTLINPFSKNAIYLNNGSPYLNIICRPVDPVFISSLSPM